MPNSEKRSADRAVAVVIAALLLALGIAAFAASQAHAANYKMLLCAASNGSNHYDTATNTASAQHPGGIFDFLNSCGQGTPDPAGDAAWLRIAEHEANGSASEGAYGSISWTVPPWIAILAGGGYTREPNAFNDGWRGRFWAEGFAGDGPHNILMQGTGAENSGISWLPTSTFAPHFWPFGSYGNYRRFIFELTCMRPAGCDRANYNAVDANSISLTLADVSPSSVWLTNTAAPLLGGQWVRGTQVLGYAFSEQGSGIRSERARVDGQERFAVDHAWECDTGSSQQSGEFARNFKPCPEGAGVERAFALDTASLSDGAHAVSACTQDYAQWKGLDGTGSESCDQRTVHTDNTPPGAPLDLRVLSSNPARYLDHFGARFALPADPGSPIAKVHYEILNAAGAVVVPERVISGVNPTELPEISGPKTAGDYQLRVWLEDFVGLLGKAATAPIPHDTTPPAAPQSVFAAPPAESRGAAGFDVSWRNLPDPGAPVDAAHYRILNGAGETVVPEHLITGASPQAIENLDTPRDRGSYALQLWLSDAEGNVGSPVSVPLSYTCERTDASAGAKLSASVAADGGPSAIVGQGEGATLRGSLLTASGSGVPGAPLCVFSRVLTDTATEFLGTALSGQDGRYGLAVPAGASRELRVIYRAGHREITSTAQLLTRVKPTFEVRRKVIRNKGIAYFQGWIPGPHNDGVVVVLQVKRGNGWLAFRRYRTRDDGRFTVGYRFNRPRAPTLYEMRAQVREQSGYPYLEGTSDPLKLAVLPRRAHARRGECQDRRPSQRTCRGNHAGRPPALSGAGRRR